MSTVAIDPGLRQRHDEWQQGLIWKGGNPDDPTVRISDDQRDEVESRYGEVVQRQEQLLAAVRAGPGAAAAYLRDSLRGDRAPDDDAIPDLTTVRTIGEMQQPPVAVEKTWYEDLGGSTLGRARAAESAFWSLAHAKWIEQGIFGEDVFTIFCEGGASTDEVRFRANLEKRTRTAKTSQDRRKAEQRASKPEYIHSATRENMLRNFLRRTSGLHVVRGSVSVLENCLVSRGWWRRLLAVEIHRTLRAEIGNSVVSPDARGAVPDLSIDQVHHVLWPPAVWEPIVSESVKRVAVANAPRARAALVAGLNDRGLPDDGTVTVPETRSALHSLGRLAHGYSLHSAPWDRLADTATHGLNNPPPRRPGADADGDVVDDEGSEGDDA